MKSGLLIKGIISLFTVLLIWSPQAFSQENKKQNNLLLETVGVLSAHSIYLTYSAIGSLADGHSNKTYEDKFSMQMLNEYNGISDNAIKQLNKLLASGILEKDDVVFVTRLIKTYELLKAEANGYSNYIRTKQSSHLKVYSEKRKAAWKNISDLLGLKQ